MDFNSSSDSSLFSGFLSCDIPAEYRGNNKGVLYNVVETCLGETITISFISKTAFDEIMTHMERMYNFTPNRDQTGQITTTNLGASKVVITAFQTNKLVVQGRESKLWMDTIFRTLDERLSQSNIMNSSDVRPTQPQQKQLKKSKSTSVLGALSKAFNFFGPPINNELVKLGKELKKAKKSARKGKTEVDYEELKAQLAAIQETGVKPKQKLHKMNKNKSSTPINHSYQCHMTNMEGEQTNLKTIYNKDDEANTYSADNVSCDSLSINVIDSQPLLEVTELSENYRYNTNHDSNTSEADQSAQSKLPQVINIESDRMHYIQLDILQEEVRSLMDENMRLKMLSNSQISKKNSQTRLQRCILSTSEDPEKQSVTEAHQKITHLTARALLLEEENLKLKRDNKTLGQENKKLQTTIRQHSTASESSEEILSKVLLLTDEVCDMKVMLGQLQTKMEKNATEADIGLLKVDLKNTVRQEITSLKTNQQRDERNTTPSSNSVAATTSECPRPAAAELQNEDQRSSENTRAQNSNIRQKQKKKVLIIGDSVIRDLDPTRLSGNNIEVYIDINPGAKVNNIQDKINSLHKKQNSIQDLDAVVVHVGINNISNADEPDCILQNFKELTQTIRKHNGKSKIIISSTLPKKTDKLSSKNIMSLNQLLSAYCSEKGFIFTDHTKNFMFNETEANKRLLRDEIHPSPKGVAVLASGLKRAVFTALNSQTGGKSSVNFPQASPRWKHQHRRKGYWNQRQGIPPGPWRMYPCW